VASLVQPETNKILNGLWKYNLYRIANQPESLLTRVLQMRKN
jgi:hypothetical protein